MRPPSPAKAAFFLSVIFLAGGVLGGFGGYSLAKQRWTQRPQREDIVKRITQDMRVHFGLTEAQLKEVEPIVRETAEEVRRVHVGTHERMERLFEDSDARILAKLTEEQKPLMKEWVLKRASFSRKRSKTSSESSPPVEDSARKPCCDGDGTRQHSKP